MNDLSSFTQVTMVDATTSQISRQGHQPGMPKLPTAQWR